MKLYEKPELTKVDVLVSERLMACSEPVVGSYFSDDEKADLLDDYNVIAYAAGES